MAAALFYGALFAERIERDWSEIYLAFNPSVSPDGSFFVFEWKDRIWRAPIAGGTAVPLGDGMSSEGRPCISPDGKKVAFLSDRWGSSQLFEATFGDDGMSLSPARQITFHTEGLMPWGYTPDGSSMLAIVHRDDGSESRDRRISRRPVTIPMERRGAEKRVFDAPAFAPALSPDGRKCLFTTLIEERGLEFRKRHKWSKTSYSGDIWLYDIDTGAFRCIVSGPDNETSPIWTPDGRGFYYLSDADGVRNARWRSFETGEERKITKFTEDHVFCPSLSRDGRTLVFANGFDLWRVDPTLESPVPERIAMRPAGFDPAEPRSIRRSYADMNNNNVSGECAFRDRGREVAFTAGGDLWVMAMDDEKRQPVCVHGSSRTHEISCEFSPDGEVLYYLSSRGDGVDLWSARRADTNKLWSANIEFVNTLIASGDVSRRRLSVSPDGRLLAWCDLSGRISFAGTNGVVKCVSQVQSVSCDGYAWSPDGRYVAATLTDAYGNADVWIIPTWVAGDGDEDPPPPCNVSRNYLWDSTPAWSPDGRIVAFAGQRTGRGDAMHVFYAYLDPADEHAEQNGGERRKESCRPDFSTLADRVRDTGVTGGCLCFSHDSRTLSYTSGGKTWKVKLPNKLSPEKLFDKVGTTAQWTTNGNDECVLRIVGRLPAKGDKTFGFSVFQTTDVQDYQELAFLTAWADARDGFCDPAMHGADWPGVREKYRLAARYAPSWSVFARLMCMMYGEIDASHLGFWAGVTAEREWANPPWQPGKRGWSIFTVHLGARFDRNHSGEGWLVKDVVPRSNADHGEKGLLAGDVVLSVDGRKVSPEMDYSEVMNGPLPHKYRLVVRRPGKEEPLDVEVEGATFSSVRALMRTAEIADVRRFVRERGNFGYLAIDAMNTESADRFTDEVFAECFGKDGLIVDVRFNVGGRTADRLIDILCGNLHARTLSRGMKDEGYLMDRYGRPVVSRLPLVVLANQRSESNAEEFTHAMHTLRRAKVVGKETAGAVIGTLEYNILDYGVGRRPRTGFFLPDGTNMEGHGAKPDVDVDLTPADIAAGRDPQLESAIAVLAAEVEREKSNPRPPLGFAH